MHQLESGLAARIAAAEVADTFGDREATSMFERLTTPTGTRLAIDGPFYGRLADLAEVISPDLNPAELLVERARIVGRGKAQRSVSRSVGGSAVMLEARDGWFVINLARPGDRASLPAFVQVDFDVWDENALAVHLARHDVGWLDEQSTLLGLAGGAVAQRCASPPSLARVTEAAGAAATSDELVIVDFTSLWAGPLCATLLHDVLTRSGRSVTTIKVEGAGRPDGARGGPPEFFTRLNGHKNSVEIDFGSEAGRRQINELVESADVVLEGSRPRVFDRLGIDPVETLARSGGIWLSITAFGRIGPRKNRSGFGDDIAAVAGVVTNDNRPNFVGDALADPVGALVGAAGVLEALRATTCCHIDLGLHDAISFLWNGTTARQIWG